jgi:hypothetical protein
MMKPEEISKLNRTIKFQRKAIEDLNKRISELEEERSLFREHFATRFKWWFQLISQSLHGLLRTTPCGYGGLRSGVSSEEVISIDPCSVLDSLHCI